MKILIISNLYPSSENAENHLGKMLLHHYARCWARNHEITVINPHTYNLLTARKLSQKRLKPSFEIDGIKVFNVPVLRLPFDKLQIRNFKKFVQKSDEFDLMIGSLPVGIEIAHFVHTKLQIPYFTYFHNTDYHRSGVSTGHVTKKYSKFVKGATGAMYVSFKLKEAFENTIPKMPRGMLLTGAISGSWLKKNTSRNFGKKLRFITSARLVKQKNIESILIGLKEVNADFNLIIAGDGPNKKNLEQIVSNHTNLIGRVSFKGMVDHDVLKNLFDENDFMILTSTNESFGLVYIEAMARGCIPIGTKGEGIDGIIEDRTNGFLCEPFEKSIQELIEEIDKIPRDKLLDISTKAMNTAKNFTYDKLADRFLEFAKTNLR